MEYKHLVGKQFVLGKQDCFTLFRDFFKDNYDLDIPNHARPDFFWDHDMNLYLDNAASYGFKEVKDHPMHYRPGDVFLMAIKSRIANHVGILLEDGNIVHHMYGGLSTAEPYRSLFRDTTVAVYRHPIVETKPSTTEKSNIDLMELLPHGIRKRLLENLSDSRAGEGGIYS